MHWENSLKRRSTGNPLPRLSLPKPFEIPELNLQGTLYQNAKLYQKLKQLKVSGFFLMLGMNYSRIIRKRMIEYYEITGVMLNKALIKQLVVGLGFPTAINGLETVTGFTMYH